jgi:hypothetical protein
MAEATRMERKRLTADTSLADRQGHRREEEMMEAKIRGKIKRWVPHATKITIHTSWERTAAFDHCCVDEINMRAAA